MSLHFIRPEWLFALLPLSVLLFFVWRTQGTNTAWNRYIAPHLAKLLVETSDKQSRNSIWLIGFVWFIATLALSGPAITKQQLPVFASTQGRVVIMDMSLSMYATDLAPNRLSQQRYKAIDLVNVLKEGETGLIAYAGDAFVISPLTRDRATLLNLIPTLSPSIMPARGSNLDTALEQAKQLLENGGHVTGDIILLTDGVNHSQFSAARETLAGSKYRLSIIGFGTHQGAPIKLPNGQLMRDRSGDIIVAQTDFDLLSQLARANQGIAIKHQTNDSDIKQIVNWLATEKQTKLTDQQGETWQDLGPYLALLLLPLVLFSFRNGFAVASLLVFINLTPKPVMAMDWDSLWKTPNQQAQQAFNNKDYATAAKQFESPQWKASADYKAGNYQQALKGFENDNSAEGLYNQANSLMQLGKYKQAEQRYKKALEKNPNLDNAKKNLELAKKLEKQQKKQQQNSGKGDSKKQNDKQGNKQDEQKNSQQSDQQKKSGQQGSDQQDSAQNKPADGQKSKDKNSAKNESPSQSEQRQNQQQSQSSDQQHDENPQQQPQAEKSQNKSAKNDAEQRKQQAQARKAKKDKADDNQKSTMAQLDGNAKPKQDLPPEMQRALKAISEDPQLLLRNKMQLEYQKRRQQGRLPKEDQQW
ncbi:MAG: VWA domain-containing protein [Parashewanella sp.]